MNPSLLLIALATPSAPQDAATPPPHLDLMAEDVEIMRLVLEHQVAEALGPAQGTSIYYPAYSTNSDAGQPVPGQFLGVIPGNAVDALGAPVASAEVQTAPNGQVADVVVEGEQPEIISYGYRSTLLNSYYDALVGNDATGIQHSSGFWAPGLGALFVLEVSVPVVLSTTVDTSNQKEEQANDLWSQFERSVRGEGDSSEANAEANSDYWSNATANLNVQFALDAQAIVRAIEAVEESLRAHADRLEHLGGGEPISVALQFRPQSNLGTGMIWNDSAPMYWSYDLNGQPGAMQRMLYGASAAGEQVDRIAVFGSEFGADPQRVVLRTTRDALAAESNLPGAASGIERTSY